MKIANYLIVPALLVASLSTAQAGNSLERVNKGRSGVFYQSTSTQKMKKVSVTQTKIETVQKQATVAAKKAKKRVYPKGRTGAGIAGR